MKNLNVLKLHFLAVSFGLLMGGTVKSQTSECIIDVKKPGAVVADICRGQQIEEFNHQFEGGFYAQLINNPSFEELGNPIAQWYLLKTGESAGKISPQTSNETEMLNSNQQHCLKFEITSLTSGNVGLANGGYWGIKLENFTVYKVSFWAKVSRNFNGTLTVKLESKGGTVFAKSSAFNPTTEWKHFTCDLFTRGITKD